MFSYFPFLRINLFKMSEETFFLVLHVSVCLHQFMINKKFTFTKTKKFATYIISFVLDICNQVFANALYMQERY